MMKKKYALLLSAAVLQAAATGSHCAQPGTNFPQLAAPTVSTLDANGVDLLSGNPVFPGPVLSIGAGDSGLSESMSGSNVPLGSKFLGGISIYEDSNCNGPEYCAHYTEGTINFATPVTIPYLNLTYEGQRQEFAYINGTHRSLSATGDSLSFSSTFVVLTTKDGSRYFFDTSYRSDVGDVTGPFALLTRIERPDGLIVSLQLSISSADSSGLGSTDPSPSYLPELPASIEPHPDYYENPETTPPPDPIPVPVGIANPLGVTSNSGWAYKIHSPEDYTNQGAFFYPLIKYRFMYNMAETYCASDTCFEQDTRIPKLGFMKYMDSVQQSGQIVEDMDWFTYTMEGNFVTDKRTELYQRKADGSGMDKVWTKYEKWKSFHKTIGEYTDAGEYYDSNTWSVYKLSSSQLYSPKQNYTYNFVSMGAGNCPSIRIPLDATPYNQSCVSSAVVNGKTYSYTHSASPIPKVSVVNPGSTTKEFKYQDIESIRSSRLTSVKDENGNVTSYENDAYGRLVRTTLPSGAYSLIDYDDRSNVTRIRQFGPSSEAGAVQTAQYPSQCTETNYKVCNKPDWVRDARGNLPENINNAAYRTDFEYWAEHGGVKLVRLPPDAAGVRQEAHYSYETKYAQIKNASGNLVNAASPIYKLVKTTTCATAATCANSVNERVTEYSYNHPNLLLTSETVRAGDSSVSATTAYAYDYVGNVVSVNGPRTDVDDISYTTYDALRRKVLEISPDPDGSGPLKRQVVRHEYDVDSLETRTESATCRDVTFTNGVPTSCSEYAWSTAKRMTYDDKVQLVKTEVVVP